MIMSPTELHPAWHLLLQHELLSNDQQLVCRLLSVSNSVRSALHAAAAGHINCRVCCSIESKYDPSIWVPQEATVKLLCSTKPILLRSDSAAESFGDWLAQHSCLLHTLDLGPGAVDSKDTVTAKMLAAAVTAKMLAAAAKGLSAAAAAAGPAGLLLQGYRGSWQDDILQQLPAARLTYLSITCADSIAWLVESEFESVGEFGPVAQFKQELLGRFVNLRHFGCVETEGGLGDNVSVLLPGLAGMTQLTSLDMGIARGVEQYYQHLPASLQHLRVGAYEVDYLTTGFADRHSMHGRYDSMNLQHLTALTQLRLVRDVDCLVQAGDILPPMVQELEVSNISDWGPVLQLRHLRTLRSRLIPGKVVDDMVTNLPNLQTVSIQDVSPDDSELQAFSKLPLVKLVDATLRSSALRLLSALTAVTHLDVHIHFGQADATPPESLQQFAVALQALPQLVELAVGYLAPVGFGNVLVRNTDVAYLPVFKVAAALPALRSLDLRRISVGEEAAAALAAASKLTRLRLWSASLRNYQAIVLLMHMPHLQQLDLSDNPDIGNEVMPVIGKQLVHLRSCNLCHTGVKGQACGWLCGLEHLQEVKLCKWVVPAAALVLGHEKVFTQLCWCQGV